MGNARILVVEDDVQMMMIASKCLRSGGYEVIPACDGMTATKLAVDEQPDVIVLDIGLPAGDGHTVAERLRNNVKTMGIPIVYVTGKNSKEDLARAEKLGASAYVVKPYRPETLLGRVAEAVRKLAPSA